MEARLGSERAHLHGAELQTIRCVRFEAELLDRSHTGPSAPSDVHVKVQSGTSHPPGGLFFQFEYDLALEGEGGGIVARVSCTYEATFMIPPGNELGVDETSAFATSVVAFAVHPYVREAVSSLCARMNIVAEPMGILAEPLGQG